MTAGNLIDTIKLPFRKDKALYRAFYSIMGFYPRNISFYREAIMHSSLSARQEGRPLNNERLEFLGDAILDAAVGDIVFRHFQRKREGFLTNARSKIVQRESLNRIGNSLHLDSHVHAMMHTSSHNSYICGNALEALVGAVYLDQGYQRCRKFIINRLIKKHFDLNDLVKTEQNFKSRLIEWTQKYRITIEYELVDSYTDADKNPVFRTAVILGGIYASDAVGYSKKESHQSASKKALDRLQHDQQFCEQVLATATN